MQHAQPFEIEETTETGRTAEDKTETSKMDREQSSIIKSEKINSDLLMPPTELPKYKDKKGKKRYKREYASPRFQGENIDEEDGEGRVTTLLQSRETSTSIVQDKTVEDKTEQKKGKRLEYAPPLEEEKVEIEETIPVAYAISGINSSLDDISIVDSVRSEVEEETEEEPIKAFMVTDNTEVVLQLQQLIEKNKKLAEKNADLEANLQRANQKVRAWENYVPPGVISRKRWCFIAIIVTILLALVAGIPIGIILPRLSTPQPTISPFPSTLLLPTTSPSNIPTTTTSSTLPSTIPSSTPTTTKPSAPTIGSLEECVTGYTSYPTGGCKGRNELGRFNFPSAAACAEKCDSKKDCVSFEYTKSGTTCQLSSSCKSLYMTVMAENDSWYWYLKSTSPSLDCIEGYKHYSTGGCKGRNELGMESVPSVALCARKCNALPDCVSFEYTKSGTACRLSNSCKSFNMTVMEENDSWYWYSKLDPTSDCSL